MSASTAEREREREQLLPELIVGPIVGMVTVMKLALAQNAQLSVW